MFDPSEIGRSIVADGINTNYHDHGSGPAVLLLHGSGPGVTAWANWRLTIPELSKRFRVIAPDLVGFGYTERPAAIRYDLNTWVTQALATLDALGIERAHVIGNSFGGALALAMAIRAPERIDRLVLMGSIGLSFELTEVLDEGWGYTPSIESVRKLIQLFAYDKSMVTDEMIRKRYEASIRPGWQESYASLFPAPRQTSLDALASDESDIRALRNETLIIHGREDRAIPPALSYRLAALIDRAQLHVFGRCGHWTQIEHAARFNRLVGDFFAES